MPRRLITAAAAAMVLALMTLRSFYWAALGVADDHHRLVRSMGPSFLITISGTDADGRWFLLGALIAIAALWSFANNRSARGYMIYLFLSA